MSVVLVGGDVRPGDRIRVQLPDPPHRPLRPV
jgi:MOSC domain-containing protein YiiM